ncbi:hypothetical protein BDZ85DRAFT_124926 [Elsinoe ampelina]|uniref:Uncharacterized protein n=1 Tax=Elsinoe ampelina TaxID=302913 RepID=A0A6A6FXM0_9PEZI|nr:hypothetical protein BDZ85DRAFT_124926 [Elsinoe ampelina]
MCTKSFICIVQVGATLMSMILKTSAQVEEVQIIVHFCLTMAMSKNGLLFELSTPSPICLCGSSCHLVHHQSLLLGSWRHHSGSTTPGCSLASLPPSKPEMGGPMERRFRCGLRLGGVTVGVEGHEHTRPIQGTRNHDPKNSSSIFQKHTVQTIPYRICTRLVRQA